MGTKYVSTLFPSVYPLNAMTIENVWIVTNARAIVAAMYIENGELIAEVNIKNQSYCCLYIKFETYWEKNDIKDSHEANLIQTLYKLRSMI